MKNGRILALDFGEKRIGIAVSDPLGIIPLGLKTIEYKSFKELSSRLKELIEQYTIKTIVIGLPLRLSGEEGETAKKVKKFGEKIEKDLMVPVQYWDERMTSIQAQKYMILMGEKTGKKKAMIDRISASVILQSFLECNR